MDQTPVLPTFRPFLRDVHHRQIQHYKQAVIGGKHGFGLGYLAQLAVETLDGVGGIDDLAHLGRILEIGAQPRPVGPPGLYSFGVFLAPEFLKTIQFRKSGRLVHGGIYALEMDLIPAPFMSCRTCALRAFFSGVILLFSINETSMLFLSYHSLEVYTKRETASERRKISGKAHGINTSHIYN